MPNRISDIKPQYVRKNDDIFDIRPKKSSVKKEIANLSKIIDKSKKLNENYIRDNYSTYAY